MGIQNKKVKNFLQVAGERNPLTLAEIRALRYSIGRLLHDGLSFFFIFRVFVVLNKRQKDVGVFLAKVHCNLLMGDGLLEYICGRRQLEITSSPDRVN